MHSSLIWAATDDDDDGECKKHGKVSSSPPASLIKFLKSAPQRHVRWSKDLGAKLGRKCLQTSAERSRTTSCRMLICGSVRPRGHVTQLCERRSGEEDEEDEEKEDEEV